MSNGESGRLDRFQNDCRAEGLGFPGFLLVCRGGAVVVGRGPAPPGDPEHGLVEVGRVRVQVLLGRGDVGVAQERLDIPQGGAVVERLRGEGVAQR